MTSSKTIAFFGSTGGCVATCLAHCLSAGHHCTALVRSPEKLTNLLATHSVTPSTIQSNLTIVTGDVRNSTDVANTILPTTDIIITGVGSYPTFKLGHFYPDLQDPTLCQDGMSTVLSVLRLRQGATKPFIVALSTTGLSKYGRDIPIPMIPLYHWLLHVPHQDKKVMEDMMIEEAGKAIGEYAIVRSSFLTDGSATGKVRSDVEDGAPARKAIGYTISRKDVGGFVFSELVQKYTSPNGSGRIFSITT